MALQQQISLRNGDYNYRNKVEKIEHFETIWIESCSCMYFDNQIFGWQDFTSLSYNYHTVFYDIYYIDPRDLIFPNMPTPGGFPSQGFILESLLYIGE